MEDAHEVWALPVQSQEFEHGPVTDITGDRVEIRCDYETPTGFDEIGCYDVAAISFTPPPQRPSIDAGDG